jgi:hypothetical protein
VHHLDEVARTDGAHVAPPLVGAGRERGEGGAQLVDDLVGTADHHAIALLQPPYAAGGAHVDVVLAVLFCTVGAAKGVFVVGVAAVHDDVALAQQWEQVVEGRVNGIPRRHHHPADAGRLQFVDEVVEGGRPCRAVVLKFLHGALIEVEADDLMPVAHEAAAHVGAHLAESNHSELHGRAKSYSYGRAVGSVRRCPIQGERDA